MLCSLEFIEARSKIGQVYGLVADYNRVQRELPEGREEARKEDERQARLDRYTKELTAYSAAWSDRRDRIARGIPLEDPEPTLPAPPKTVPFMPSTPTAERHGNWTLPEKVKAWGNFVANHIQQLSAGEEPIFQLAWNSADAGPVAEKLAEVQSTGLGPKGEWLRLQNRPPFALNPECLKKLEGHTEGVNAVALSVYGRRAVSGSGDGTLRVWDLETGESRVLVGHTDWVRAVTLSPDGRRAVSGSDDNTLRVWDVEMGSAAILCALPGGATCTATGRLAVVADEGDGRVDLLRWENYSPGPSIVSATRLWLFDRQQWDTNLTVLCPSCGDRFVVKDEWFGREVNCPSEACDQALKFNPFVYDWRDRRILPDLP